MKRNSTLLIRNIFVSLILLGSAAFFFRLFLRELNRAAENIGGVAVGEIVEIRGQAQRRYNRSDQWGTLKGEEALFHLDGIRTGTDSGVVIVIRTANEFGEEEQDEISLGPDTYVILDVFGKSRNINFIGGSIAASGSRGLTVSSEGTVVSAEGGSVNLSRSEDGETQVTAAEGEVKVSRNGEETVLGVDTVLRIDDKAGTAVQERAVIVPLSPQSNALLLTYGEERKVDFTWSTLADWREPLLEISSNPGFEAERTTAVSADERASTRLAPGRWYWRITDSDSGESGPVSSFNIDSERPASLLSPVGGTTIPFRGENAAVSLQWNRAWFADSYSVELSRSGNFAEVPEIREVTGGAVLVEGIEAGRWWWRVKPNYRRGILDEEPIIEGGSFVLEERSGRDPIRLVSPPDGSRLSVLEVRRGIDFRWLTQDGIDSYRIRAARDSGFSSLAADFEGRENWRTLLTNPEPGRYFWQVEARAADGEDVPPSPVYSLEITPVSGSVELVDPAPGGNRPLEPYAPHTFIWRSGIPGTVRFMIHRITDGARRVVVESLLLGETFTVPLPGEGTYSWKVEILDEGGRMLVGSREAVFRLGNVVSPAVPRSPSSGAVVSALNALRRGVRLQWSGESPPGNWRVEVRGGGTVRVFDTDAPEAVIPKLDAGRYTWTVLSRDESGRTIAESSPRSFTVSQLPNPPRPVVTFPKNGADIDMTGARNLVFSWVNARNAGFYDLALYAGNSRTPLLRETGLRGSRYQLDDLGILDVGDFVLELTARNEYPDLGTSRSSPAARVRFSLSLNISDEAPRILTDELQYGD